MFINYAFFSHLLSFLVVQILKQLKKVDFCKLFHMMYNELDILIQTVPIIDLIFTSFDCNEQVLMNHHSAISSNGNFFAPNNFYLRFLADSIVHFAKSHALFHSSKKKFFFPVLHHFSLCITCRRFQIFINSFELLMTRIGFAINSRP